VASVWDSDISVGLWHQCVTVTSVWDSDISVGQ